MSHYDSETTAATNSQPNPLALLGAMLDDNIITFPYRGLQVTRIGNSIAVAKSLKGNTLGGRLLIESADLLEAKEWLDAKADLYGGEE